MSTITEEQIRLRAYALWEADGRPDGKNNDHWERAYQELIAEGATAAPAAQKTAMKKKKATIAVADTDPKPAKRRASPGPKTLSQV